MGELIQRSVNAALLVLVGGCTEYSYTSEIQTDVFHQVHRNTVDILMVVDNSCSMAEEQEKLASNFKSFIDAFEGVDVDWQIGVITTDTFQEQYKGRLIGGDDEIILVNQSGRTVDEVAYDRTWPIQPGAALQLDPSAFSSSANDSMDNWCLASETFGQGDLGTPGTANTTCARRRRTSHNTESTDTGRGDTGSSGDTGSTDTGSGGDTGGSGLAQPQAGEVIITEFLADPAAVDDAVGEWVELTNTTEAALDLSGATLEDRGRNSFVFPDGTTIAANGRLVVGPSTDTGENGGAPVDVATGDDFTLNNDVVVLTPETDDVESIFGEMVAVGTSGSGIEMGMEAARRALSEPLVSGDNAGFLRDNANLSLIFVSDENDFSPDPVDDYLRFFTDLKGESAYRDHRVMNISAVVGKDPPPYEGAYSCQSSDGLANYGERYVDLANRTDGALDSICDEDFSPIASELGLTASGLEVEFALSELPDLSTLTVKLYGSQDESSLISELTRDVDYTYMPGRNALHFDPDQAPPSDSYIVAQYRVLANGSRVTDTGGAR